MTDTDPDAIDTDAAQELEEQRPEPVVIDFPEDATATVTVSRKRAIDHEDADAAGFTEGYAWKVEDRLGTWQSACATREEAIATAYEVARQHGYSEDQIAGP